MKVQKVEGSVERRIVIAMVVSDAVLSRIASRWPKGGLCRSKWANEIGNWCVEHHKKYDRAPGKSIQAIYEAWAEQSADQESVKEIDRLLSSLNGEYVKAKKDINPEHVCDLASKHFNTVRLERLRDNLEADLEIGNVEKAMKRLEESKPVNMEPTRRIDVLRDEEAIREAFESKSESLVKFKGALGEFFGDSLERDGLVALYAPEKRGKSFFLQEICWQAMRQGRKVAMFQVGDMSKNQIMRRFSVRAAGRPLKAMTDLKIPMKIGRNESDEIEVENVVKSWKEELSWGTALKGAEKTTKRTRSNSEMLALSVHPNTSISVLGIMECLDSWERDGFTAEIVCVDYADILAPVSGAADTRDAINMTWKMLRRLSQERHCLVLTASQTDAASYETDLIRRSNFSEDKRKYAHTTAIFGLNQTDVEKEEGRMRLNWLVLRDGDFIETKVVHVAGSLALANPMITSCW